MSGNIGLSGAVVRTVAENLHDNIGGLEHGSPVRENLRALGRVVRIGKAAGDARPALQHNFQSGLRQCRKHIRHQRHPALTRKSFLGDPNDHETVLQSDAHILCIRLIYAKACLNRAQ